MKGKMIIGIIAIMSVSSVLMFSGCVEKPEITTTPIPTVTLSPALSSVLSPTPTLTPTPTPEPTPTPITPSPADVAIISYSESLSKEEFKKYGGCDLSDTFMVDFKGAYRGVHKIGEPIPGFGLSITNSGNVVMKNLKVNIIPYYIDCDQSSRIRNDEICTFKYFYNPTSGTVLNKAPETYEADVVLAMGTGDSVVYWVFPNVQMYGLGTHLIDCDVYITSTEPPFSWSGDVYLAIRNTEI